MVNVRSIRYRAALLMCALLLAAIAAYSVAAYREIAKAAMDSAHDRLHAVSTEFRGLLGASAAEMVERVDSIRTDPAVTGRMRDGAGLTAVLNDRDSGANVLYTAVTDTAGRQVAATRSARAIPLTREDLRRAREEGGAIVGEMRAIGDTVVYPIVGPVERGGELLGFVARWRKLAIAGGSRGRLEEMIGSGAHMYIVNSSGDLWTDFSRPLPTPDVELSELRDGLEYTGVEDEAVLAIAGPIPGTPWSFVVEFPRDAVVAGPERLIRRLLVFGLLVLLAGVALAWLAAGRLTGSVEELATAARDLKRGDYRRRVRVDGHDEIGTLASAFNSMAESVGTSHEALQRKLLELAALEAQHRSMHERLEHLITSSRTVMYQLDLAREQPVLAWISENVERLFGSSVEEAMRPGWWVDHVHPDDRRLAADVRERFAREREITLEYRFRNDDGEYRLIRDEQRGLAGEHGEVYQVVGTMSDITESRKLRSERDAAEAASQAKSEFLSRMSHELRTPMNSILGFAQLLALELDDPDDIESANHILRGGRHLLQLIDEVLDIARIESGGISLSLEPVAVNDVLRESVDLIRTMAEQHEITLSAHPCKRFVRADRQRLKQVLLNLLSNAVKYNRPGGSVRVGCEPRGADRLRIYVSDDGPGIAPEAVGRMFTPFERLGAEQSGIAGTGLGLSLSRGFAEAMEGELGVDSEPGRGSTFWIELSLAQPHSVAEPDGVDERRPRTDGEALRNVLYIEDNASNFHLVERLLRRYRNVRVIPAMQGRLGLQLARQHRPDLILLDVHLPDMQGHEVLEELQRDERLGDVPVIVISADATPKQFERLIAGGAREYLTKPFDVTRLMSAIDGALEPGA